MQKLSIAILMVVLTGCASGGAPIKYKPISIAVAKGSKTATVYLTRQSHWLKTNVPANIIFDGKPIGVIKNGQCVRLKLPSGTHHLVVASSDILFGNAASSANYSLAQSFGFQNLQMKPGQTQFFLTQLEYDSPGVYLFQTRRQSSGRKC